MITLKWQMLEDFALCNFQDLKILHVHTGTTNIQNCWYEYECRES